MKAPMTSEIEEFLDGMFPHADGVDIGVGNKQFVLTIRQEYEPPNISFKQIDEIAKFFDTLNVETDSEYSGGGCDTCGWGSYGELIIHVRPGDAYRKVSDDL